MGTATESFVELTERIGRKTGGLSVSPSVLSKKGSDEPLAFVTVGGCGEGGLCEGWGACWGWWTGRETRAGSRHSPWAAPSGASLSSPGLCGGPAVPRKQAGLFRSQAKQKPGLLFSSGPDSLCNPRPPACLPPLPPAQVRGKAMGDKAGDMLDIARDILLTARLDDRGRFKQARCGWVAAGCV